MHLHSSSKTGGSSAKSAWVILGIDSRLSIVLYVGMPRKLRIEYAGAMCHVMSRGDRREKIYLDDVEFSRRSPKRLPRACTWVAQRRQIGACTATCAGRSCQRGPGATGVMTNGPTRNNRSYGLTPL